MTKPSSATSTALDDATVAALRGIHYPVETYLGSFDHGWLRSERRVTERFRTSEDVLTWIEDRIPRHVPDVRYPESCGEACGDFELRGPVCAFCGAGLDEDGDWQGQLWPCPTADVLGLDRDAPACTCSYVWREQHRVHDPDCMYMAWVALVDNDESATR